MTFRVRGVSTVNLGEIGYLPPFIDNASTSHQARFRTTTARRPYKKQYEVRPGHTFDNECKSKSNIRVVLTCF